MSANANPHAEPLLTVSGVETYYGSIRALSGVDVHVNKGEIVSLIGANGAGKSTLMMTICGSPQARNGSVVFDGTDITKMPTHLIARRRIAGQEAHSDRIVAGLGQGDARAGCPAAQQRIGYLNQNPGAVAQQGVRAHRAAMIDLEQNLQAALHDFVGSDATNIREEADAARVVLVAGIVQTLVLRIAHPAI